MDRSCGNVDLIGKRDRGQKFVNQIALCFIRCDHADGKGLIGIPLRDLICQKADKLKGEQSGINLIGRLSNLFRAVNTLIFFYRKFDQVQRFNFENAVQI